MYALVVRFEVRPESVAAFDRLVAQTLEEIREYEPRTLTYLPTAVVDAPASRVFIEVYEDEAAFVEHERQPHVRHFLQAREPLLESVRVERLTEVPTA